MRLTIEQVAQFAINAGFTGPELATAIAVCYGESSFDPGVYNPEVKAGTPTGEGSVGLWQIYTKDWPHLAKWNLHDPQVNACAANVVWLKLGWNAWASYKLKSSGYQEGVKLAQALASSTTPTPPASQSATIPAATDEGELDT